MSKESSSTQLKRLLQEKENLTLEFKEKFSIRRNELIADLFYRMDNIERAGTGIKRIGPDK